MFLACTTATAVATMQCRNVNGRVEISSAIGYHYGIVPYLGDLCLEAGEAFQEGLVAVVEDHAQMFERHLPAVVEGDWRFFADLAAPGPSHMAFQVPPGAP